MFECHGRHDSVTWHEHSCWLDTLPSLRLQRHGRYRSCDWAPILFFNAGLQSYEAVTKAKSAYTDLGHLFHKIEIEQHRLRDWKHRVEGAFSSIEPDARDHERDRLITSTLARIARLFSDLEGTMAEYNEDQSASSKTSLPKPRN